MMRTGIVLLNFGEPEVATPAAVIPYLERIFWINSSLEEGTSEEERRRHGRELAARRAPGLIAEYERIGGSPLNRQASAQADALRAELRDRGFRVATYVGMQFTEPSIRSAVRRANAEGIRRLVGLPVYPLCGASTTVAALAELAAAVREVAAGIELFEVSGWHTHPGYVRLRADGIRAFAAASDLDLRDEETLLYFSAHGTPLRYLAGGVPYDRYVEESCRLVAEALGVDRYVIGFQNHGNRNIPWTQPDNEHLIACIEAARIVVVPISFMHEQSETLAELDLELRAEAEERGLAFHRVPVPHDDPRFAAVLAELVLPFLDGRDPGAAGLGPCRCRAGHGTLCLNARRA